MSAIIRKNSNGYNYRYADLEQTHRYLEEQGLSYWQEVDVVDGVDYIVTVVVDSSGKELRRSRGCRITLPAGGASGGKSNICQEAGSALTYARRYSLWMALGLCCADDDGAALTVKPERKVAKPDRKATDRQTHSIDPFDRKAGVDAVKRLLDTGVLQLSDVQAEVRKYGADKMQDLPLSDFVRCVATLTGRA